MPVQHLTPKELAARLRMSEAQLANWRSQGKGPAYIRGESTGDKATIRYRLADVEKWEQSRLVVPVAS